VVTYTVHEALIPPRELDRRADEIVFIKEGFSWWAFFAPLPWLLYKRLWFEALAYVLISIVIVFAVIGSPGTEEKLNILILLLNVLTGFEANDLLRWAMERRGRKLIAVVSGRNFDECERRFFEDWLPFARQDQARRWSNPQAGRGVGSNPAATVQPGPEGGASAPSGQRFPAPMGDPIIGFPGEGG
jgi:hypothetical protein